MLRKATKASAPLWFLEQCETLRAMTAGRRIRSARLVGGLDSFHLQKSQQVAAILLQPDSVQQLLIIVIPKDTVAEMSGQLQIQLLRTSPVFIPAESATRVPER